ncbi:unnamed protein product [Arctogadus glacialis]
MEAGSCRPPASITTDLTQMHITHLADEPFIRNSTEECLSAYPAQLRLNPLSQSVFHALVAVLNWLALAHHQHNPVFHRRTQTPGVCAARSAQAHGEQGYGITQGAIRPPARQRLPVSRSLWLPGLERL